MLAPAATDTSLASIWAPSRPRGPVVMRREWSDKRSAGDRRRSGQPSVARRILGARGVLALVGARHRHRPGRRLRVAPLLPLELVASLAARGPRPRLADVRTGTWPRRRDVR